MEGGIEERYSSVLENYGYGTPEFGHMGRAGVSKGRSVEGWPGPAVIDRVWPLAVTENLLWFDLKRRSTLGERWLPESL